MIRATVLLRRVLPLPTLTRRFPTQNLRARDETLFNLLRQTLWQLESSKKPLIDDAANSYGDAQRSSVAAVSVEELQDALPSDALREVSRRNSTLRAVLQQCPGWFIVHDDVEHVALTKSARQLKGQSHADLTLNDVSSAPHADAVHPDETSSRSLVRIGSPTHPVVHIDTSRPILTSAEIEAMQLPNMVAAAHIPFMPNVAPDVPVRHLVDKNGGTHPPMESSSALDSQEALLRMEEVLGPYDVLYRKKGLIAPSECLNVLVEYIPSFYVELGKAFYNIPMNIRLQLFDNVEMDHNGRYRSLAKPFLDYPMLFELEQSGYRRSLIRLNMEMPFVRSHPRYGAANRELRKFSKEFSEARGVISRDKVRLQFAATSKTVIGEGVEASSSASVPRHLRLARGGPSTDTKIFQILLSHIPRGPPTAENSGDLYTFTPLVPWIHSFPQDEINLLNEVPQERVLTILAKYRRIFQLSSVDASDSNLYSPWLENPWRNAVQSNVEPPPPTEEERTTHHHPSVVYTDDSPTTRMNDDASVDEAHDVTQEEHEDPVQDETLASVERRSIAPESASNECDAATLKRVASFKAALSDELLGLDDLLSPGGEGHETFDKGEGEMSESNTGDDDDHDSAAEESRRSQPHQNEVNVGGRNRHEAAASYVPAVSSFDVLCVRRLPHLIAPGALSDLDASTTPDTVLLQHVLKFLAPPPSPTSQDVGALRKWRWVLVETIYRAIPNDQRFRLKCYRGLPNFMRLHGRLLEVSFDTQYVIMHDPSGERIPPLIPTQRQFSIEERTVLPKRFDHEASGEAAAKAVLDADVELRARYRVVLKDSQVPTNRQQLKLLEPGNPLLDNTVLAEEIAGFLPHHPVAFIQLMSRLPPIMKAALSTSSAPRKFFVKFPNMFNMFYDTASGKTMIARVGQQQGTGAAGTDAAAASPPNRPARSEPPWSLSRVLHTIDELLARSTRPLTPYRIGRVLPREAHKAIQRETSHAKLEHLLELYPERYQLVWEDDRQYVRKAR